MQKRFSKEYVRRGKQNNYFKKTLTMFYIKRSMLNYVSYKMKYVKAGVMMFTSGLPETYVALVKGSYSGRWGFPKGNIDSGETPKQAAVREFKEETGVPILEPSLEYTLRVSGDTPKLFYVSVVNKKFQMKPEDAEISEAKWFSIQELSQHRSFTYDVRMLDRILRGYSRNDEHIKLAAFIRSL